jgi:hypothetical protein
MNAFALSRWIIALTGWWDTHKLDSCMTRTDLIAYIDADIDDDGCDDDQLTHSARAEYMYSAASHASRPDGVLVLRNFHKVVK